MKVKKTYSIDSELAIKTKVMASQREITASLLVETALQIYLQRLQENIKKVA